MRCEGVREQLAEHLLGTLESPTNAQVREHLRGCASCRSEMGALGDGVNMFAQAAHRTAPPQELKHRVLSVLQEEWASEDRPAAPPRRGYAWLGRAAAVVLIVGSLAWGAAATQRASRFESDARSYEHFLSVLNGEDVRVTRLLPAGGGNVSGSAVLYDAEAGEQSWGLVLARAPGMEGTARVTLSAPDGRTIKMHELEFEADGEAATWLVTPSNIQSFVRVTITAPDGTVLATGVARGE